MKRLSVGIVGLVLFFVSGCGPVQSTIHRDEHLEIYHEIFSEEKPEDVDVVHSFLISYTPE